MIISPGIPGVLNRLTPNQGSAFRLHFLPVRSIFSVLLSDLFCDSRKWFTKTKHGFQKDHCPREYSQAACSGYPRYRFTFNEHQVAHRMTSFLHWLYNSKFFAYYLLKHWLDPFGAELC